MRTKKAQIAGQIFIYVLAVIIVTFIIVYGYNAIKGFSQKSEEVAYATLQTDMTNAVSVILSDYGSIKRPSFKIPGKYKKVCVMNLDKDLAVNSGKAEQGSICDEFDEINYEPLACEGWKIGRDNVYLIPDGSEHFNIGTVEVLGDEGYHCFDVVNGRIPIQFKSLGDKVEVKQFS